MAYVLPLGSADADLAAIGGKGLNLARMARAGFPVPPGFLIATSAYRAFVDAHGLRSAILAAAHAASEDDPDALARAAALIRGLFDAHAMPRDVADAITAAWTALSAQAVAVRSSATAEDLPGLSFAGQQDTYLNVIGAAGVLDAVKRCWASLWTARALGYRARNGIPPEDVSLAVVIQAMVPAEASGVLFTANPLTGHRGQMVIDASFGLGEAIVSGQVEPDHYVVDAAAGRILDRRLGAKALAILPDEAGGTRAVSGARGTEQALTDAEILALTSMAARVAGHYGAPQDIEWARAGGHLYLLQARPITSLYPMPEDAPAGDGLRVYFSFNSVQGVADPITPLGISALRSLFGGIGRVLGLQQSGEQLMLAAGGRLFIDITGIASDPRAQPVYMFAMSGVDPGTRDILKRLIAEGRLPPRRTVTTRALWRTLRSLAPLWLRAARTLHDPERRAADGIAAGDVVVARSLETARSAGPGLGAVLDRMRADLGDCLGGVMRAEFPVIVPGLVAARVVHQWLTGWLGENSSAALNLMRGVHNNPTTQMNLRLWRVAQTIRADGVSRDAFARQPVEALAAAFSRGALPDPAQRELAAFMDEYGMRGNAEIDLGRERWRDDPTPLLQTLRGYVLIDDPAAEPDRLFERGVTEAGRLTVALVERARRLPLGFVRARALGGMIRRMRALVGLREQPKFCMVRFLDGWRTALLAQGSALAAQGALASAEDIFFVPFAQLRAFADGAPHDLRVIVARERANYAFERARRRMPRVLLSTGEAFYEGLSGNSAAGELGGQGVSPGVAEGLVRVILDPRDERLNPGEILVCPATDPGWTPLFFAAGGLIMEVGGMMTHGAVVAREYGIPAVAGVHEATTRLKTGMRVRVDGADGRIVVIGAPGTPAP